MYRKRRIKPDKRLDSTRDLSLADKEKEHIVLFEEFLQYRKQNTPQTSFSDRDANLVQLFEEFLHHKKQKQTDSIPLSIFRNTGLGPLETVVKYLREEKHHTYRKISTILNRNPGPIGVTYRKAKQKLPSKLKISPSQSIPISFFKKSKLTIFETIVLYLKDNLKLEFRTIASILNRNYRTVWTVYKRAKKKC
ncbi:MAG: hypothetical protein QGH47_06635 [Candidatus Woesearchaeota archaeon]|jgi:DNA-directed RNA polymerase specialized sigma24 family protein|nr:hypothetical protein [Candidatus Woesearchaeota archaeon]